MSEHSSTRRILVTGASGSIGSAIAKHHHDLGWEVFAQFHSTTPSVAGVTAIATDLSREGSGAELVEEVRPHLIINCAADQSVLPIDSDEIYAKSTEMLAINLLAPLEIMRTASRVGTEICINISSIEALKARPGHALYGASKAALESLTRTAALELAPMRILGLRLGLISRPGLAEAWPEGVNAWIAASPLKRMGTPEEVARAVAALASDDFAWATGNTIDLDGGINAAPGW